MIYINGNCTKGKKKPDCLSICRSENSGGGIGVMYPNIERGPYGVTDRLRHPVRADERWFVLGAQVAGFVSCNQWSKWRNKGETSVEGRTVRTHGGGGTERYSAPLLKCFHSGSDRAFPRVKTVE